MVMAPAETNDHDQTKTAFSLLGGLLALIGGWLGFKKQSGATEQAKLEGEAKKAQIEADAEARELQLEAQKVEARARIAEAESREHESEIRRTQTLEEMVDSLQRRVLRQGNEALGLRAELARVTYQLINVACSCTCPECDKCTERLKRARNMMSIDSIKAGGLNAPDVKDE
jgi:hypothetical protein